MSVTNSLPENNSLTVSNGGYAYIKGNLTLGTTVAQGNAETNAINLAGGQLVLEAVARELKIEVGGITEDHEFDLDRVACIGCCALAPVVTIGQDVFPKMTPPKVEEVMVELNPPSAHKD